MAECTLIAEIPITNGAFAAYAAQIDRALKLLAKKEKLADISIKLTNDPNIQALNYQFRGKNKPTNVLSFPCDEADYLGDIAISLDTIVREAMEQKKSVTHHFTHMVIHGILHLVGHDHENEKDAESMEALEINILKELNIDNPYVN